MALNFPSSPTNGQQYTDSNAVIWEYDGVKWNVITGTANKTYSGAKVSFTSLYSLTANSTAISFDSEVFDTDIYFSVSTPTRITFHRHAFYRINFSVYTDSAGSSYTIIIKKNGSTNLASVTLAPNQYTNYDEILEFSPDDYIEVYGQESSAVGALTTSTFLEVTQLGLSLGTFVSSAEGFSGVRTILTSPYSTTNTSAAIQWSNTAFNQNANPAGSLYWTASSPERITVKINGFYRVKAVIATGSTDTYSVTLKKNTLTDVSTTTIESNGYAQIDEIYQLIADDFLELFVSDSVSTGSLTTSSYFEVVRIGV